MTNLVTTKRWAAIMVVLLGMLLASACSDDDSKCQSGTCDSTADAGTLPADATPSKADSAKLPPWCDPTTPSIVPPACRKRPCPQPKGMVYCDYGGYHGTTVSPTIEWIDDGIVKLCTELVATNTLVSDKPGQKGIYGRDLCSIVLDSDPTKTKKPL